MALCVRECFDCIEIGNDDDTAESLRVKSGEGQQGAALRGLCQTPASQGEWALGEFYKRLPEGPWSPAFAHAQCPLARCLLEKQHSREEASRRFLECVGDSFLMQLENEPT